MGTSLTGTKPKDTYDSLIKVGDNGPISGTAKTLSDGLGNDLPIAVSTSNVGIGTSSPAFKLEVGGASPVVAINRASGDQPKLAFATLGSEHGSIIANASSGENRFSIGPSVGWGGFHTFYTNTVERVRITDNGLTFNGDTAAANALDDYEEGTFTATLLGSTTNPTTPVTTTGSYTKIGRQVTVSVTFSNVNTTGAAGSVSVSGLPFTIGSTSIGGALTEFFDFGGTRTAVTSVANVGLSILNFYSMGDDAAFDNLTHNAGTGRFLWATITYFV